MKYQVTVRTNQSDFTVNTDTLYGALRVYEALNKNKYKNECVDFWKIEVVEKDYYVKPEKVEENIRYYLDKAPWED